VAAHAKRYAGVKGDLDHFGALDFLQGILAVLRDAGQAGLLLILLMKLTQADSRDCTS
jgi:hypothetical protein